MKLKFVIPFTLFSFFMVNIDAQNLSTHQWKNRLILILTNDATPPELQAQLIEFRTHSAGMKERKLVVYQVQANQFQRGLNADNEWMDSNKLYQKYKSDDAPFEVILIGLDGGIKLTQNDILTCEKLFAIIDAMPMRRREMRDKRIERRDLRGERRDERIERRDKRLETREETREFRLETRDKRI